MRTKEEFYALVQQLREIVADPENQKCPCPNLNCEWHGRCLECVTLHRYFRDHLPCCFQQFVNDKLKAVAALGEMTAVEKERTPAAYWDYVRQRDQEQAGG